jgi:hypothetical protein
MDGRPPLNPESLLLELRSYANHVVVLYGTVFDDKDRAVAEGTANAVPGVTSLSTICGPRPANGPRKRSVSIPSS